MEAEAKVALEEVEGEVVMAEVAVHMPCDNNDGNDDSDACDGMDWHSTSNS